MRGAPCSRVLDRLNDLNRRELGLPRRSVAFCVLLVCLAQPRMVAAQTPVPSDESADQTATHDQPPPPAPPSDPLGFRFHGYLRSGFGVDGTGKGQQPFIAPL